MDKVHQLHQARIQQVVNRHRTAHQARALQIGQAHQARGRIEQTGKLHPARPVVQPCVLELVDRHQPRGQQLRQGDMSPEQPGPNQIPFAYQPGPNELAAVNTAEPLDLFGRDQSQSDQLVQGRKLGQRQRPGIVQSLQVQQRRTRIDIRRGDQSRLGQLRKLR